jgi:AraC-like DNA-binding protein
MDGRSVNRMEFFSELISCGANLSYWQLDPDLKLVESTALNADTLYAYFTMSECYDFLKSYVASKTEGPVVLTAAIGLCWIASLEISSGNVCRVHMIGPAFTEEISVENIRHMFYKKKYPETMVREFLEQMNALPLIPLTTWLQYGTMLHYTVSGERVHFSDFNYQVAKRQEDVHSAALGLSGSKTSAWLAEQHAMQMIEEGCLDYQAASQKLSEFSAYLPSMTGHLAETKRSSQFYTTLCTRAAVRGGLDPETALTVGDRYIESIDGAASPTEVMQINSAMYDDFVRRVHKLKEQSGVSTTVQACCNYIVLHISDKLTLNLLSEKFGYSPSRLAQKFKIEVGCSVPQYIKEKRIERARQMLYATQKSVQEIGDELGFCNTSYFVETFRGVVGMTPGEFRGKPD